MEKPLALKHSRVTTKNPVENQRFLNQFPTSADLHAQVEISKASVWFTADPRAL